VRFVKLDLADQAQIARAAGALVAARTPLSLLINNAGIMAVPLSRDARGFESQFATNHLGHFLLTQLLLPKLERGEDPRVVTVSSGFGKKGLLDFDNLDAKKGYSQGRAYMQSKLANSLFGAELDRRLRASGSSVKSVIVHPGVAATEMQQKPKGLLGVAARFVARFLARSARNAALPTIEAALGASVQSGEVYGPGKGKTAPALRESTWPSMQDVEQGATLWRRSEELLGMSAAPGASVSALRLD
jgi:NAD(P)-dependent dehydrogenase (short-subunit alcohol dehydrogenase family)